MDVEVAAETAYGLVSRAQARSAGMSESAIDRLLASGRWVTVLPSVYRIRGVPVTARQRAFAAALWAGPGSVVSHGVAARLLRLDAIPRPQTIDITVPRSTGLHAAGIVVHRMRLDPGDRVLVDEIPCTSATRTIVDLAAVLDDERLETAFDSARRLRLTSLPALARRADELCGRGRPGSARLRRLLALAGARPLESRLEVRTARLLRAAGMSAPARQFAVGRYRLDFAWPALLLALECDGFEHHGRRLVWKRDRRRVATLEARGWRIVHVTWDDVTAHPDETLARLHGALARAA